MVVVAEVGLTELERKLLRLALCSSAHPGEIAISAQKLVESWRSRGIDSATIEHALDGSSNTLEPTIVMFRPDFGLTIMPWGKFKGQMLMDIEPSYLRWALKWINEAKDRAIRFQDLADDIEQFLKQGS